MKIKFTKLEELITQAMNMLIDGVCSEQNNFLIYGDVGVGKTSFIEKLIGDFFGTKKIPLYGEFKKGGKTISMIYVRNCGTLDMTTVSVPHVGAIGVDMNFIEQYEKEMHITSGIKKAVVKKAAEEICVENALTYIVGDSYKKALKSDCIVAVLGDINRNPDDSFNRYLKSLTDREIGGEKLPPMMVIMTANRFNQNLMNSPIDSTVKTTCSIFDIELASRDAAYYCSAPWPEMAPFFHIYPEMICAATPIDDVEDNRLCPRSWASALQFGKYLFDNGKWDLLESALCSKVGRPAGIKFLTYMKEHTVLVDDSPEKVAEKINHDRGINIRELVANLIVQEKSPTFFIDLIEKIEKKSDKIAIGQYIVRSENIVAIQAKPDYVSLMEVISETNG